MRYSIDEANQIYSALNYLELSGGTFMPDSGSKSEPSSVLADFEKVVKAERAAIRKRRRKNKQDVGTSKEITNLVGLSLSGGGVRSASFCLGALQALEANGL